MPRRGIPEEVGRRKRLLEIVLIHIGIDCVQEMTIFKSKLSAAAFFDLFGSPTVVIIQECSMQSIRIECDSKFHTESTTRYSPCSLS